MMVGEKCADMMLADAASREIQERRRRAERAAVLTGSGQMRTGAPFE